MSVYVGTQPRVLLDISLLPVGISDVNVSFFCERKLSFFCFRSKKNKISFFLVSSSNAPAHKTFIYAFDHAQR
jgi:hypothetical protein